MPDRLRYLREVMMPASFVCWAMEDGGMIVDESVRVRHLCDLETQEKVLRDKVFKVPAVRTALAARVAAAEYDVAVLEQARVDERSAHKAEGAKGQLAFSRAKALTAARARLRTLTAEGFNPGSTQQRAWLLYEVFALPPQKKRDSGGRTHTTTDKNAVAALLRLKWDAKRKPVTDEVRGVLTLLRDIGHLEQLRTTFVEAAAKAPLEPGRKHRLMRTQLGLHRTATGRMASGADADEKAGESDSNMQNWPKQLRDMIVPRPGFVFVQGDWSQVEWLLTLYFAGDDASWARVVGGEDAHRRVASVLYGVDYDAVTAEQRQTAKKVRHAVNYSAGIKKVADSTGLTVEQAQRVIDADAAAYPLVAAWRKRICEQGYKQRYLETPFGWRRWFMGPVPDVPKMLAFMPSATGADMLKVRVPEVAALARTHGGRIVTCTHDSALVEVPAEHGKTVAKAMKLAFESPFATLGGRSFPADVKVGLDWKEVS